MSVFNEYEINISGTIFCTVINSKYLVHSRSRNKSREDKVYDYVLSSELRTEPEYKDS
jgi:hypothetical protein